MRNMVRPFRADRNLLEDACPMDEVLAELSAQLAEFRALKALQAPVVAPA